MGRFPAGEPPHGLLVFAQRGEGAPAGAPWGAFSLAKGPQSPKMRLKQGLRAQVRAPPSPPDLVRRLTRHLFKKVDEKFGLRTRIRKMIHFPTQKREKTWSTTSCVARLPVNVSSASTARSMQTHTAS